MQVEGEAYVVAEEASLDSYHTGFEQDQGLDHIGFAVQVQESQMYEWVVRAVEMVFSQRVQLE